MSATFREILDEYYSLYRGQGTTTPRYGVDREYATAVKAANNAIRKWSRVDGTIWKELITSVVANGTTITIASGTTEYICPDNMDVYGTTISIIDGDNSSPIVVSEPHEVMTLVDGDYATFIGDPNNGYTLKLSSSIVENNIGNTVDFVYIKKPTYFPTDSSADDVIPEMSDVNFMIQSMLRARYTTSKNGFGVSIANKDADDALLYMKNRNNSAFYGRQDRVIGSGLSWGSFAGANDWKF